MNLNLNLHLVESVFLEKSTKKQRTRQRKFTALLLQILLQKVVTSIVQGFQAMINEIG